jgi:hypothetical protein
VGFYKDEGILERELFQYDLEEGLEEEEEKKRLVVPEDTRFLEANLDDCRSVLTR